MIYIVGAAIISFGIGWAIGFAQGIGYLIGKELERRKRKGRQSGPSSP
jgi:hypothetical protein